MHTTLVRWNPVPDAEIIRAIELKMQELLGDEWETYNRLFKFVFDEEGRYVSVRYWPSLATAEAWIEFMNSFGDRIGSANISLE
jgi:hypothetical protein